MERKREREGGREKQRVEREGENVDSKSDCSVTVLRASLHFAVYDP
jgi:hypothetical protein